MEFGKMKWELLARCIRLSPEKMGMQRGWPSRQAQCLFSWPKNKTEIYEDRKYSYPKSQGMVIHAGNSSTWEPEEGFYPSLDYTVRPWSKILTKSPLASSYFHAPKRSQREIQVHCLDLKRLCVPIPQQPCLRAKNLRLIYVSGLTITCMKTPSAYGRWQPGPWSTHAFSIKEGIFPGRLLGKAPGWEGCEFPLHRIGKQPDAWGDVAMVKHEYEEEV